VGYFEVRFALYLALWKCGNNASPIVSGMEEHFANGSNNLTHSEFGL
jgi:hypothetical protein